MLVGKNISKSFGEVKVLQNINVEFQLGNIISIFGSSSPFYTPPLMKNNNGEVIYKQLDCSPCFKNSCPLSKEDNLRCLTSITVDEISKKAQPYLD